MEEEKVIVKLKKEPLSSEIEERAKKKRKNITFIAFFVVFLVVGVVIGYSIHTIIYQATDFNKYETIKNQMKSNWLYKNEYEDLDTVLDDKALYGMTYFDFDPYTSYMSKEENQVFTDGMNMNYVGIGIQYYQHNGEAIVTRVFKESPASNAGVEVGDIITMVDNVVVKGLDSDEIKKLVLGQEGSTVDVTINRKGTTSTLTIVRGKVDSTVYASLQDEIVILNIMSFGENTAEECVKYLDEYKDYSKLIIDLRDNSGGLQIALQKVAGLFIGGDKVCMLQTYADGYVEQAKTISSVYYDNFKDIVILTNRSTASAAEVLAICLKEQHDNVTLVGLTTFGKGVVQSRFELNDMSTVKITTSKWSSPNGVSINGEGVKPDVEVFMDDIFYVELLDMEQDEEYKYDEVSNCIKVAQIALNYIGYESNREDGYFDKDFEEVLDKYKRDHGLNENHILDKQTYDSIVEEVSYLYSIDKTKDTQMNKAKEVIKNG